MPATTIETAAAERRRAVAQRTLRPSQRRDHVDPRCARRSPDRQAAAASAPMPAQLRAERAAGEADGAELVTLRGYATTYGQPYSMWDFYGEYLEVVEPGAGAVSLAADPDVKFLFDHAGLPMARTRSAETLDLSEDDHGLLSVARVEMGLQISRDVVLMVERHLVDEMSFAFVIKRGIWSPDYTQYTIKEYDIHRGDTSAVTYGANPTTEIGAERGEADAEDAARRTLSAEDLQRARRVLAGGLLT